MRRAARTELVAIASRDEPRARGRRRALGIPRAHGSYEALLADPDVDAVYIPLPNHLHAEWAIAAARAGKHVLCEKPLAMTAADAERMVRAADDAGVHLMEAFMYRHHPSWVAAIELVRAGRIGTVRSVQSWFSYYNDDPDNIRNILSAGGGALYDIGCYNVSLSRLRVRRRAGRRPGERDPRCGDRHGRADQRAAAVRGRGRHVHLLDPPRDRPARPHLRRRRPDQHRHPVQHPADPADPHPPDPRWRAAGAPRTRRRSRSSRPIPTASRSRPSRARSSTAGRRPVPGSDAVANLRVIERIFAAGEGR